MTCFTCKHLLNIEVSHSKGTACPVRDSIWCSQCSIRGHTALDCTLVVHVKRPATLEELIPDDVRARWGIQTHTLIVWPTSQTLEDKEREISDANTIEVRFTDGKLDRSIRDVMRSLKIDTVHKMSDNLNNLRKWAVSNGKKVVLEAV